LYKGSSYSVQESQSRERYYSQERAKYESNYNNISSAISAAESAESNIAELKKFLTERTVWPLIMEEIFRAKPDNVWIDSITPVMGEMQEVMTASVTQDEGGAFGDEMGGLGGGSLGFGGSDSMSSESIGMGGMGGLGESGPTVEKVTVAGFTIEAHTISIPGAKGVGPEPVLAPEPEYPFSVPEKSAPEGEEEADNSDDEEALEGEEEAAPRTPAKPKEIDLSGENLFVHNLRKSKLFSNEELMTTIKERNNNEHLSNGFDFTVQVKFNAEIEAYPWPFEAAGSSGKGGMDAGMGGSRSSARSARDL
ncbi:MAG: hypothetical protein J6S21_00260, partial [Victivallales bacterium]|nr:hypothetical protein [Victivallales bacterium]